MHKRSSVIGLILALSILFGMAFRCGNDNDNGGTGNGGTTTRSGSGFEDGHVLKGRYSNADQGIKSFTFYTDGTFKRAGASSGTVRGGEYVASQSGSGKYYVSGKTLRLTYENGKSEDLTIDIMGRQDYSQQSPTILSISGVHYTNVD